MYDQQSKESLVSLMNIKNLVMVSPNFPKNGKVVVVSKMTSLDMGMIKIVMMSNFIAPKLLNVRVLKLSHYFSSAWC